ncbi:hypothetical protein U1Q18_005998 [Sarracenia purpurea var. burkii]
MSRCFPYRPSGYSLNTDRKEALIESIKGYVRGSLECLVSLVSVPLPVIEDETGMSKWIPCQAEEHCSESTALHSMNSIGMMTSASDLLASGFVSDLGLHGLCSDMVYEITWNHDLGSSLSDAYLMYLIISLLCSPATIETDSVDGELLGSVESVLKPSCSEIVVSGALKLQREGEKAKAESRKGRKRSGIKEKRRENKVDGKTRVSEFVYNENKKFNEEKTHKWRKHTVDLRGRSSECTKEDETEQLERSGLTEEHEQPVCPKDSCYSADSAQNINKRKRQASPVIGIRSHGNIIRIRLQPQEHKEPYIAVSEEEKACSTSGRRIETTGKQNSGIGQRPTQEEFCPTSVKIDDVCSQSFTPRSNKEQSCSTSGGIIISNPWATYGSTSSENGNRVLSSLYEDLVENWVPPLLSMEEQKDIEELEWLFQRKKGPDREKRSIASCDVLCGTESSTLWPRAQYLPEAGLYALPFTVPF